MVWTEPKTFVAQQVLTAQEMNEQVRDNLSWLKANSFPVGGIIMWSGTVANIPEGWSLCDGANGTPDLRNKFVAGAGDEYEVGDEGGEDAVKLEQENLPAHTHEGPSHTHGSGSLSTGTNGSHSHADITRRASASGTHGHSLSTSGLSAPPSNWSGTNDTISTGLAGSHSHSISGSTASGGLEKTGSTGSGFSHENRPPYYALAFIMRVA